MLRYIMNNLLKYFLPNQKLSKTQTQYILFGWLGFSLLLWFFSPFRFLPTPVETYSALKDLWAYDNLAQELFISIKLNIETILVATVISLGLAYANTIAFFKPVVSLIGKLRFLSMVGLTFFFTLMVSNGFQLKLSILTFSVTVFYVTSLVDVFSSVPQEQYDLARTLRMNDWQILWEVIVRGQLDQVFIVMRQNAAMGFLMLSFVESLDRSGGGIGGILLDQGKYFHMAAVVAIQMTILTIGLTQDWLIGFGRRKVCKYVDLQR